MILWKHGLFNFLWVFRETSILYILLTNLKDLFILLSPQIFIHVSPRVFQILSDGWLLLEELSEPEGRVNIFEGEPSKQCHHVPGNIGHWIVMRHPASLDRHFHHLIYLLKIKSKADAGASHGHAAASTSFVEFKHKWLARINLV